MSTNFLARRDKGFSSIELMVSIFIMVAISTVVFMNQKQFGAGAALRNIVNNLSLSLRQAQIYGISVKEFQTGSHQAYTISSFTAGYGVYVNTASDPASYINFTDRQRTVGASVIAPDGLYSSSVSCPPAGTGSPPSECIDKVLLTGGHTITALCTIRVGVEDCSNTRVDITFKRPAVEAKIIFNGDETGSSGLNVACIEVSSPEGKKNAVVVYTTGQISVRGLACTDAI